MNQPPLRVVVFLISFLAAFHVAVHSTYGQFNPPRGAVESPAFQPVPRALKQRFGRAQKALADKRYSEAIVDLGNILAGKSDDEDANESDGQDYFLPVTGDSKTMTSLKSEVTRMIGDLPLKGQELYELQFGTDARALLDEAVSSGDTAKLAEVTRKYFHTTAGYEAAFLLARWNLDQGQPLAAALMFQHIWKAPRALARFDPELSILLAISWKYAGQDSKAVEVLNELKKHATAPTVQLDGKPIELFKKSSDALEWLVKLSGAADLVAPGQLAQWLMFRGNATRSGQAFGSAPLMLPRWRATVHNDVGDELIVQQLQKRALDQGTPLIPSLQALAVGDTILMRTPEQLVGVDFRTGKVVWVYPWTESTENSTVPMRGEPRGGNQRENDLNQRMCEDWAYGQLSSDGESVFFLDKLSIAQANRFRGGMVPMGFGRNPNGMILNSNQLIALDLKREGALRWIVGEDTGWDEPKLAGGFFLGSPLPLAGSLYVIVELQGEIRLACLNPKNGHLIWSQQISHTENRTILADSVRRLAGTTPSYSDGIMICPTSLGTVVAVDIASRSLLWGFQYPATTHTGFDNQPYNRMPAGYSRWVDSTATIVDGKVIVTPVDSTDIHCLDLLTGKLNWKAKREQNLAEMLFVDAVYKDSVIIVGKRAVTALKASNGEPAWRKPIELFSSSGEVASGRGFRADRYYFLPIANGQIFKIDCEDGTIAQRIPTGTPMGNLIGYRDEIISLSLSHLSVHYQIDSLRKNVRARLDKSPNDAWALTRMGELLLHDGKPQEAFASLLKAREQKPQDDGVTNLVVESFLAALEKDFAATLPYVEQIEPLLSSSEQRGKLLKMIANGAGSRGDFVASFEACVKMADIIGNADSPMDTLEDVAPSWRITRDRWIQVRITDLLEKANDEARAKMASVIQARFDAAEKSNSVPALRRFVSHFQSHPLSDRARISLAKRMFDTDELLEAEIMILPLIAHADPKMASAATYQWARILEKARRPREAAEVLVRLRDMWPDVVCDGERTGRQIFDAIPADSPLQNYLGPTKTWPNGTVVTKETPVDALSTQMRGTPQVFSPTGPIGGQLNDVMEFIPDQKLTVRDARGLESLRINVPSNGYHAERTAARKYGHTLIFSNGVSTFGIDTFRDSRMGEDAILWPHDPPESQITTFAVAREAAVASNNPFDGIALRNPAASGLGPIGRFGAIYLQRSLQCLDLMTGKPVWVRTNMPSDAEVFGNDEIVGVINRVSKDTKDVLTQTNEVVLYRVTDGMELRRFNMPQHDGRWAFHGQNILYWKEVTVDAGDNGIGKKSVIELHLWNALTQETIWQESVMKLSKGKVIKGDELVVVEPEGKSFIRSLVEPSRRLDFTVEPEITLNNLVVLRSDDLYHIIVNRTPLNNVTPSSLNSRQVEVPLVYGKVYCVDRKTGEQRWPAPATLENMRILLHQPPESPVLTFVGEYSSSGPIRIGSVVLCLDKRDGRKVFEKRQASQPGNVPDIRCFPEVPMMQITAGPVTVDLRFTDEPRSPEPPLQHFSPGGKD